MGALAKAKQRSGTLFVYNPWDRKLEEELEVKLTRTAALNQMTKILDLEKQYWRPCFMLYRVGKDVSVDLLLDKEGDMSLGGIVEVLIYFKVGKKEETISTSTKPRNHSRSSLSRVFLER